MVRSLFLVFLVGCAYPAAMKRGAALESQGDARAALAQYDRALGARPRSDDALAARERVIAAAVDAALADGQAALERGAHAEALDQVAYVDERIASEPRAAALRIAVGDDLVRATRADFDQGAWSPGYDRAALLRELLPERPEGVELLAAARAFHYAAADTAADQGQWRAALDALDAVGRREHDRADEVGARADAVRGRWADELAARADEREREGLLGPALALRARAVEVAARAGDTQAVDRLIRALRAEGSVAVDVRWSGAAARTSALSAGVWAPEGLVWGPGGLQLDVVAPEAACAEGWAPWTAEQPYVSGRREVRNPRYDELTTEVAQARWSLEAQGPAEQQAAEREWQARSAVQQAEAELGRTWAPLAAAQAEIDAAAAQIEGAQRMVGDCEAQLAAARESGSPELLLVAEMNLAGATQRLTEHQSRLAAAQSRVAELQPAYDEGSRRVEGARSALAQANADVGRLADRRGQLEGAVAALDAELRATPPTLWEDVIDTFRYEVRRHTRKCVAEVSVTASGGPIVTRTERYADAQETSDDAHPAWPEYGVAEDPLAYPAHDAAMVAEVDGRLAAGVSGAVERAVADAYRARFAAARDLFAARPDQGAGPLLGLLLAAPSAADPATRDQVERWLRATYELEAPAVITR